MPAPAGAFSPECGTKIGRAPGGTGPGIDLAPTGVFVVAGTVRLLVGAGGFEPPASCSQSRRANQAAPHPVEPIRSLPSMGRDPRRRRASQEPPAAVTAEPGSAFQSCPASANGPAGPWLSPPRPAATVRRRCPEPVRCPCFLVPRHSSYRTRGRSSMAEPQPSKLVMRVRFPSPAPTRNPRSAAYNRLRPGHRHTPQRVRVPLTCH